MVPECSSCTEFLHGCFYLSGKMIAFALCDVVAQPTYIKATHNRLFHTLQVESDLPKILSIFQDHKMSFILPILEHDL